MRKKWKEYMVVGVVSMVTMALVSGCNSTSNTTNIETTNSQSASQEEGKSEFPITIQHAFGTTVIKEKPERVATIAWGNQDVPLALGVVPVGASKANYGVTDENGLLPWTANEYKNLGEENPVVFDDVDGLDYEAISDTNPDVILCVYSGITQEEYDMLSQIAPVVPYTQQAWVTTWREQTLVEAESLGMKEQGEKLVADTEALIEEKINEYGVKGKTGAFFYVSPNDLGSFYIYLPQDCRASYLMDLGIEFPNSVKELAKDTKEFSLLLSSEHADKLSDIDVIVMYGDESVLEAMQKDPLLGSIPAIKNGAVALIDNNTSFAASCTPSILSIPDTIDEYLGLIKEALGKAE